MIVHLKGNSVNVTVIMTPDSGIVLDNVQSVALSTLDILCYGCRVRETYTAAVTSDNSDNIRLTNIAFQIFPSSSCYSAAAAFLNSTLCITKLLFR